MCARKARAARAPRGAPLCRSRRSAPNRSRDGRARGPPSDGPWRPWRRSRLPRSRNSAGRRRLPSAPGRAGRARGCRPPARGRAGGRDERRTAHGQKSGLKDVHAVDFGDAGEADGSIGASQDRRLERSTAFCLEQLRVGNLARRYGGGPPAPNATAAAITGPPQGPRPASSIPATRPSAASSSEKSGRSRGTCRFAMSASTTGAGARGQRRAGGSEEDECAGSREAGGTAPCRD